MLRLLVLFWLLTIQLFSPSAFVVEHLSHAEGKALLDHFSAEFETSDQWLERAARVRQGMLRGMKLDVPPAKTPLNPIIHSRREFDSYSVENVAFESLPECMYRWLSGSDELGLA